MFLSALPILALLLLGAATTVRSQNLSNGGSGSGGCRGCVAFSRCQQGECTCRPGFEGNGYVLCNNPNVYYRCVSSSDPGYSTLAHENYVNHVIGNTRLVQMTTERFGGGKCDFRLYGWTARNVGKFYYQGLSFRLDLYDSNGDRIVRRGHIRGIAAAAGRYAWAVRIVEGQDGDPSAEETYTSTGSDQVFQEINTPGCNIQFRRITGDYIRVQISCCGIRFGMRQYHPSHPDIIPGFFYQVLKSSNPSYDTWQDLKTEPLCMEHTGNVSIRDVINNTGITLGTREAMTFHAIVNTPMTQYPTAPANLDVFKSMMRACPSEKLDKLFQKFWFLFSRPQIARCLGSANSRSVAHLIQAILHAIGYACHDSVDSCQPLSFVMTRSACLGVLERNSDIASIVRADCPDGAMDNQFGTDQQANVDED